MLRKMGQPDVYYACNHPCLDYDLDDEEPSVPKKEENKLGLSCAKLSRSWG
jgi:hypothetical protein